MPSTYGNNIKTTIYGTSHGPEIGVIIEGLPKGEVFSMEQLNAFLKRRSPVGKKYSTKRNEPDLIIFKEGVQVTGDVAEITGSRIDACIKNKDQHSKDYDKLKYVPRPGHADFAAMMKDGIESDLSGGGRFSGRLTAALCIAGGIAMQLLSKDKISISGRIVLIGGETEGKAIAKKLEEAETAGDSLGGVIECTVTGVKAGSCGESSFGGLEGRISSAVFGIPAVKGIEFGNGFECSSLKGSENNDEFCIDETGMVKTKTNHHGGILGGIASGMPIVFRAAIKPTPSISLEQNSVNLKEMKPVKLTIQGRHDPCIVPRAVPCIEAACALAILDALSEPDSRPYGLLGRKLSHSFSPKIHRLIGEAAGKPYEYVLFEKEPEEVEDFIKNGSWAGLNVTIPYKETVMSYCDEISDEARAIGAVNTLVRRDSRIIGYNTDYFGFMAMMKPAEEDTVGAKCLVLGSGGASKTVCHALKIMGANSVTVLSRKGPVDYSMLNDYRDADIIVNTTPVGMYPDTGKSAVYPGTFPRLKWVCDVIYNPLRTNLLCQGKKSMIGTISGLKMLVMQAKASSEFFLKEKIDDEICNEIEKSIRCEKENIVLIGMPGSGKSSVGRLVAEKLGRTFIDTDELIKEKTGMTIPDIFSEYGEERFRDIEAEIIKNVGKETSAVISCGGGVVTGEENYYSLAENGRLIFLNRDIELLPVEGRPVSLSTPMKRLYDMRLPLYRSWCDNELETTDLTLKESAEIIAEAYM